MRVQAIILMLYIRALIGPRAKKSRKELLGPNIKTRLVSVHYFAFNSSSVGS